MITFNRECPSHDAVAKFYLTPIQKFKPWVYMDRNRLNDILNECYKYGNPTTKKMIEEFNAMQ